MTKEQRGVLFQRLLVLEVAIYQQKHFTGVSTNHLTSRTVDHICDEVERVLAGVYRYEMAK